MDCFGKNRLGSLGGKSGNPQQTDAGRRIFTATTVPSNSVARWTWAIEAELRGFSSKEAYNSSTGLPKYFSIRERTLAMSMGATLEQIPARASQQLAGMYSVCCEVIVCPQIPRYISGAMNCISCPMSL